MGRGTQRCTVRTDGLAGILYQFLCSIVRTFTWPLLRAPGLSNAQTYQVMQESLSDKIWPIIIDKFAIGLIVAFAGFWLSRILERFKSREAFTSEIMKARATKISETWSAMYSWEAIVRDCLHTAAEIQVQHASDLSKRNEQLLIQVVPLENQSKSLSRVARNSVEANRFWLGEELYGHFQNYSNNLMGLLNAYSSDNVAVFNSTSKKIDQAKQNIFLFMEKSQHGA